MDETVTPIEAKFAALATDNAPGQEARRSEAGLQALLRGKGISGPSVDFSHGDVDAFLPTPGSIEAFVAGVQPGSGQAYTEYRGGSAIRDVLAERLAMFTGAPVSAADGLIITPGSQGALFLAMAATVARGDRVAVVQPDYFANRKLVEFLEGALVPIRLNYESIADRAGLDLSQLEDAFKQGVRVFLFSNPNNPTGAIYSPEEVQAIADLASGYGVTVIADQLYSRLLYDSRIYAHIRTHMDADKVITIMGPSKTESLSGYRLGVAFGAPSIISRMEKLQAIVSLRAAGYSQAVLQTWFAEPEGWLLERIALHQIIRDDLLAALRQVPDLTVRATEAGSYVFPRLPPLAVPTQDFVRILRLQAEVTVTPGAEFGPHCTNSVRLNFSQDRTNALAAANRMAEIVERYRR